MKPAANQMCLRSSDQADRIKRRDKGEAGRPRRANIELRYRGGDLMM